MIRRKGRDGRGNSAVQGPEIEKIGVVEWFEVRRHSRRLYILLDQKDCDIYDIQMGDKLQAKLLEVLRGPREEVT
jgi:hypothetical protein